MDMVDLNSIVLQFYQTLISVQTSPIFMAFQDSFRSTLLILRRLNKQYNPLLINSEVEKSPPVIIHQCKSSDLEVLLREALIVLGIITFIAVIIRCIWSWQKEKHEDSRLLDTQIRENKMLLKEDCERLKTIYGVLLDLKSQLPTAFESGKFCPPAGFTRRKYQFFRSLYSNASKSYRVENYHGADETTEDLKENLHKALSLLEEQIDLKSLTDPQSRDVANPLPQSEEPDFEDACESPELNPLLSEAKDDCHAQQTEETVARRESHMKDMWRVADTFEADGEQRSVGACSECARMRKVVQFLLGQPTDWNAPNGGAAEPRTAQVSRKDSAGKKDSNLRVNPHSILVSSGKRSNCGYASSNSNEMVKKVKDPLNVQANKNALNVEILFNRNVHLKEK